ncbi:Molybdopterin binding protein [Lactarius quietus]|nr:Molybdopterin binding protein [Lactarius quietus]
MYLTLCISNYRPFVLRRRFPTFRTMTTTRNSSTAAPKVPTSAFASTRIRFELSPLPSNPLGEGRWIKTAGALIIGDEILNGKTLDRNSNYFARYCFENGIELKRIEVIPDEEDEIIEASRRMVQKYDLVITTGGIGPTHDDITYASLAKAFDQPLVHHAETLRRMAEMSKHRSWLHTQDEEQRHARERMALFPANAEALFVASDIWVPVVRLERKLCVFPGIPSLFQKMLEGLKAFLPLAPSSERPFRHQIFTVLPESSIAPYLTRLQKRVKDEGVRVGSYPRLMKGVYVSLIGQNEARIRELGKEVEENIQGTVVTEQEIREAKAATL